MKKLVLSALVLAFSFSYAQKKEIQAAYKALENGDVNTAKSKINEANSLLGNKTQLLEPETLEQFYFVKGLELATSGKISEGAAMLAKIADMAKQKVYTGKDAEKNKVYFWGEQAAKSSGISGLKEENYNPVTLPKLATFINPYLQKANQDAVTAYNAKNYDIAGDKFKETYMLLKVAGQDNGQFLYNAALSYAYAKKNDKALAIMQQLVDSGYTGVEVVYTAKNKAGKVENFDKNTWELLKKSSDYSEFKTETTKSIEPEIYEETVRLLIESGKNDEAIALIEKGLKKFPNNARLSELQGVVFYKSGKTDQYIDNLKAQVAKNPNDKTNWYNLGVLQSKNPVMVADAEASFKKALDLDPKMSNAWQNLTFLTMGDDGKAVDEIKAATKNGKTELANKLLQERRNRFAKTLPYAEKWYETDPNNIDAVEFLRDLYKSTKNDAKAAEFKVKAEALNKK
jgi:predicted Zn-dependent protease